MLGKPSDGAQKHFLDTAVPFSFRLGGTDSKTFLKSWKQESSTKDAADRVVHQVSWIDPATGLRVTAEATAFKRYPAVDWVLYFENQGQKDTPILEDIRALDAMVKTADAKQPAALHRLNGDTCNEQSFLPTETALPAGQGIAMAPCGGRPSNTTRVSILQFRICRARHHHAPLVGRANGPPSLIAQRKARLVCAPAWRKRIWCFIPAKKSEAHASC